MIEAIRKQIKKDSGILVIPANTTNKKPPLPYATINVTSPWIDERGHADIFRYADETGMHMQRSEMYQFVMSLNLYAETDLTTMQLANVIRNWFVMNGEQFLEEELNAVVVSRSAIQDRATFLVDSYEYKYGFDVRIRTAHDERFINNYQDGEGATYDWIETVELEFKGVE